MQTRRQGDRETRRSGGWVAKQEVASPLCPCLLGLPVSLSPCLYHPPMPGTFLVLDGTEGSGKSTQARLLEQKLTGLGREVQLVRDPGTTRIGEQIRAILLDPAHGEMSMRCEMLLYMSARAQMMKEVLGPALEAGKVVICDRFVSSTLAYQLGGDGLTAQEIRSIADVAIKGRWPDLTFILDLPVEKSLARLNRPKDRIEQRAVSYHEQVRQNYLSQVRENPEKYRLIEADRGVEAIPENIWRETCRLLV
jgi:dTMP kinase